MLANNANQNDISKFKISFYFLRCKQLFIKPTIGICIIIVIRNSLVFMSVILFFFLPFLVDSTCANIYKLPETLNSFCLQIKRTTNNRNNIYVFNNHLFKLEQQISIGRACAKKYTSVYSVDRKLIPVSWIHNINRSICGRWKFCDFSIKDTKNERSLISLSDER